MESYAPFGEVLALQRRCAPFASRIIIEDGVHGHCAQVRRRGHPFVLFLRAVVTTIRFTTRCAAAAGPSRYDPEKKDAPVLACIVMNLSTSWQREFVGDHKIGHDTSS